MISEWASNPHEPSNPIVMPGPARTCSGYPGIHVVAPSSEGSGTTTDRCAAPVDVEGGLSKTLAGRRRGTPVDGRDKPTGVRFKMVDRVHDIDSIRFLTFSGVWDTNGDQCHAAPE